MAEHILIIEDEASLAEAVAYTLQQEGSQVTVAADGHAALAAFEQARPDLVVLDLMLPGINGWDLFQAFRKQRPGVPVIMLTARAEEADRVAGLEMGADDYVTKPFSMRELVARVRTVLRRAQSPDEPVSPTLSRFGVVVDRARHEVTVEGEAVRLTPREFDLLAYLMEHAGRVRTRDQILQAVWAQEDFLDERTVDVHIRWLRTKIESNPSQPERLLTVRGVGYKYAENP
ncbi:MAG: response regulator transcription factor [Armatimonadetes bacterium]|nr:response regulator transcription factor [Armatimonadota bacterium]